MLLQYNKLQLNPAARSYAVVTQEQRHIQLLGSHLSIANPADIQCISSQATSNTSTLSILKPLAFDDRAVPYVPESRRSPHRP